MRERRRAVDCEGHVVDVAVPPVLAWFVALDERVAGLVEVRGGVAVGRVVAATHVAAHHAHPQVHPPTADSEAVLAAFAARLHVGDLVEVAATGHEVPFGVSLGVGCYLSARGCPAASRQHSICARASSRSQSAASRIVPSPCPKNTRRSLVNSTDTTPPTARPRSCQIVLLIVPGPGSRPGRSSRPRRPQTVGRILAPLAQRVVLTVGEDRSRTWRGSAGLESPADQQVVMGWHRWAMGDLNARPLPCRGSALTPELIAR